MYAPDRCSLAAPKRQGIRFFLACSLTATGSEAAAGVARGIEGLWLVERLCEDIGPVDRFIELANFCARRR